MVWFTGAAKNDHVLLEKLKLDSSTIYVFDKEYNDYRAFNRFGETQTGFVTRIKDNAVYRTLETNPVAEEIHSGLLEDQIIEVIVKDGCRRARSSCAESGFTTVPSSASSSF